MASTVLTVAETRILSSGKSPVRINQIASRIIPRFLPARVLVTANLVPLLSDELFFELEARDFHLDVRARVGVAHAVEGYVYRKGFVGR